MPSWELFEALPQAERDLVLPPSVTARLAVELGVRQGWERYTGGQGDMLGVERFGASAPGEVLLREYGFTVDNVCARATALLRSAGGGVCITGQTDVAILSDDATKADRATPRYHGFCAEVMVGGQSPLCRPTHRSSAGLGARRRRLSTTIVERRGSSL